MRTANTDADTTREQVRRLAVLPCEWAAAALAAGTSFLTAIQFYDTFLGPVIADPAYASIITWWKAATTEVPAGAVIRRPVSVDIDGVFPDPASREPLQRWVAWIVAH